MKHIIFVIFFLISSFVYSQEGKCFKSLKEATSYVIGDWKLKNEKANIYYRFVSKEKKVFTEIIVDLDYYSSDEKEKFIFESNQEIEILNFNGCFRVGVQITAKFGSVFYQFVFSSKNEFIYNDDIFIREKSK